MSSASCEADHAGRCAIGDPMGAVTCPLPARHGTIVAVLNVVNEKPVPLLPEERKRTPNPNTA
jgi:hypothetical protein